MRNIYIAFLMLLSLTASAQNKDSLLNVIPSVKNEAERIRLMYLLLNDSGDSDPVKALYYHKKLLAQAQKMKDKAGEAVLTAELGYGLFMTGNSAAGTELVFKAVILAEEAESQQAIGIAYDNLAITSNDDKKSIIYLQKALVASQIAKDYLFICWELNNLSQFYSRMGKIDSALHYSQRALAVATANNVYQAMPGTLQLAGDIQYELKQKGLALEYYRAALKERSTDAKTQSSVYFAFSDFYAKEGKRDSALYYAHSAYKASKQGYYSLQAGPARLLSKLYDKFDSDSALKYTKLHHSIIDSLYSTQQVQQMEIQSILEEERQLNLINERNHNLQYAAIGFGMVVLIIFFFLLSHSVIANQKLIRFLGVIALLIVFEFLNLLLHPYLGELTHHSPVLMLLSMVCIAGLLVPIHHKLEHWITYKMVEKNNRIRLTAAKKVIAELEVN